MTWLRWLRRFIKPQVTKEEADRAARELEIARRREEHSRHRVASALDRLNSAIEKGGAHNVRLR